MGLHTDSETVGITPVRTHVRRMIWHQLSILDVRTTEAQGPYPVMRTEFVTARFPLNVDDDELEQANPPKEDAKRWTEMTLTRIRMECNEFIRSVYMDRNLVEKKVITITAVLGKIKKFRDDMQTKYHPLMNDQIPVQRYARLVMEVSIRRTYAMLLHRYHMSVDVKIPGKLKYISLLHTTLTKRHQIVYEKYSWILG